MNSSITKEFAKCLRGTGILFAMWQGITIPFQLLMAAFMGGMVASAVAGEGAMVLRKGALLLVCVIVYKCLESLLKIRYQQVLTKARQECRMKLYRWYMENPLHKLYSFQQGKFLERVNDDFSVVIGKFCRWIPLLAVNVLAAVIYFGYVGRQSWILALLFLAMAMLQIVPELAIKRLEEKIYEENRDVEAEITEWMTAAYRGFSTIKNFDLTEWYMQRLKKLHEDNISIGRQASGIGAAESSAHKLISYLLQYGVCVAAGLFVLWGKLSLNEAIVAITVSGSFFVAVKTLFMAIPEFAVVDVAEKRLQEWKINPEEPRRLVGETGVHLSNVSFSYGEKQVFCHKSEVLETDGICIIKGENGCGKSTLLKLVAGLLSCDEGCVALGKDVVQRKDVVQGKDVVQRKDAAQRNNVIRENDVVQGNNMSQMQEIFFDRCRILYLVQERLHIDMTAEEYIALFSELDEQYMRENLRDFHIEEELLQRALNSLSGGEEKKIMLSIMLAMRSPLLLLDEPETSLDIEGQKVLAQKLKERGRGVLMITHGELFDGIASRIYNVKAENVKVK